MLRFLSSRFFTCVAPLCVELTHQNVETIFQSLPTQFVHQSYQETAVAQRHYCGPNIIQLSNKNNVEYYSVDTKREIGSGCSGNVYAAVDLTNSRMNIVVKYGHIGNDEVKCLQRVGLYIAQSTSIVLMLRAPGVSYETILQDSLTTDERKIQMHRKIISSFDHLKQLGIFHGDTQPRHIFVENDLVTFIDFGESELVSNVQQLDFFSSHDVDCFNGHVDSLATSFCGAKFHSYMKTQYRRPWIFSELADTWNSLFGWNVSKL